MPREHPLVRLNFYGRVGSYLFVLAIVLAARG
jgi:hypothetical protein